jgi:hypothetical protein
MEVRKPQGVPVRSYSTRFAVDEDPISEGGVWLLGKSHGLDWADIKAKGGRAFGETIPLKVPERPAGGDFEWPDVAQPLSIDEQVARVTGAHTTESFVGDATDPTAILAGPWGRDQYSRCTVFCRKPSEEYFHEVQLRLRFAVAPHVISGYELMFRVLKTKVGYAEICRWNGPVGDWTSLDRNVGPEFGVEHGDVIEASMIGNVVKGYINGREVLSATDDTFPIGNPGFGFNFGNADTYVDYGITSFVTDTYDG